MIIVDYSGTFISVLYSSRLMDMFETKNKEAPDINLVRHAVLNTLRTYKKQFKNKAGKEMIIAADSTRSWRKDYYQHYKGNRKKNRDVSSIDWNSVFDMMNQLLSEINQFTPFKTMKVPTTEADDIIAVLSDFHSKTYSANAVIHDARSHSLFDAPADSSEFHSNKTIIVSEDKDFHQLQRFDGVEQFYPRKKKFFVDPDPRISLMEKIIHGDAGDGVPNILSDDDTFMIEGKRQKIINANRLNTITPWAKQQIEYTDGLFDSSVSVPNGFDVVPGWCRNRIMIDLGFIPDEIQINILNEYHSQEHSEKGADVMLDYLIENKCKNLISDLQDFFN